MGVLFLFLLFVPWIFLNENCFCIFPYAQAIQATLQRLAPALAQKQELKTLSEVFVSFDKTKVTSWRQSNNLGTANKRQDGSDLCDKKLCDLLELPGDKST